MSFTASAPSTLSVNFTWSGTTASAHDFGRKKGRYQPKLGFTCQRLLSRCWNWKTHFRGDISGGPQYAEVARFTCCATATATPLAPGCTSFLQELSPESHGYGLRRPASSSRTVAPAGPTKRNCTTLCAGFRCFSSVTVTRNSGFNTGRWS